MTGTTWIILNIALAVGAIYGTAAALGGKDSAPLEITMPEEEGGAARSGKTDRPQQTSAAKPAVQERGPLQSADLDDLWQMSLFNPGRSENPQSAGENPQQTAAAAQNVQFELVGIAQISAEGKESVPVAVLRTRASGGARPANAPGVPGLFRRPGTQPQQTAAAPKKAQKEVFAVGDAVNDSGYMVKSISPKERMVELSRAGTVVKLYIDFKDSDAVKRREAAAADAQKRQSEAEAAEKAQNAAAVPQTIPALTPREQEASRTPPAPPGARPGTQGSSVQNQGMRPTGPGGSPGAVQSWSRDGRPDDNSAANAANEARSQRIQELIRRRQQQREQQFNFPPREQR